jgi:hypothetical protein
MHSTFPGRLPRLNPAQVSLMPVISIFLILGTLTTLWALASPMMAVPDEPAHAIKAAAVVRGQMQGQPSGKQGEPALVQVPQYFAELGLQLCYGFNAEKTADCAPEVNADHRALTPALTSAGNYNPFYYLVVGVPSRVLAGGPALYAMRIVSGLFSAVFLTMAFAAARRMKHSQWPLIGCVVSLTPMVLFLGGSINPNSLEIATTAALFLNLAVVLENTVNLSKVRGPLWAVGLSAVALANTRALSLLWLALAVVVALIMFGWRPFLSVMKTKLGMAMTALIGLGCAGALGWLLVADSFKSLGGIPSAVTPDQAFVTMLDRTFSYTEGYIGLMGWLDTPAPKGVQMLWHFAIAAVLLAGLTARLRRSRWALGLLMLSIVLLPAILQAQVIQDIGYIWQGRYLLALIALLVIASAVALRDRSFGVTPINRTAGRWALGAIAAAQFYAFIYSLRRYTVGIFPEHTNWSEMWGSVWQPPLGWQVLSIAYLITLAVGAVVTYGALFPKLPLRKAMPGFVRYEEVSMTPAKVETGRLASVTVPDEGERRDAL